MGEKGIQGGDRSYPRRRLTVAQAADQLGITVDAVRARIKHETISHVREGGRVYVILDDDQDTDQESAQHAARADRDELVQELRDRVRYLEEESRRKDHLLAAALERIPAIEASSEATGAVEMAASEAGRATAPDEGQGQHHPVERPSWWRRFFGFE